MLEKNNNTPPGNGQPSLEARAFQIAFIPPKSTDLTQLWSLQASAAIAALIDFRSSVHRWQAAGQVSDADFVTQVQLLDEVGLAGWLDELIGLAMREVMR